MMNFTTPVLKKDQPDDAYKFLPLPAPSGEYPYHLRLSDILPETNPERLVFHMVGDTGGIGRPEARQNIVGQMANQHIEGGFLYHLGDLVYHYGEAEQYSEQFYKPFESYPGPIFAIAGNHDSDVNPDSTIPYKSLDAFTNAFCDSIPQRVVFSGKSKRKSMVQPNVYWTLETSLATIIGLHTNVTKYGAVVPEQENWFREELMAAPANKILIVCLHHAPYSADTNHGSSQPMIRMLENSFTITGVKPDVVFSGHVHNYQRFHKTYEDGSEVPYIVAGAGGFEELHSIATTSDKRFTNIDLPGISLKNANDSLHGFLQVVIEQNKNELRLTGKYYAVNGTSRILSDFFTICKSPNR